MQGQNRTERPSGGEEGSVWTPGDMMQRDAVVAGCAMVAQADGWVTADERTRLVERMRHSPTVAFFGTDDVLTLFEALNLRFERDPDDGETVAEVAVARLRGLPGPSRMLIETACSVAEADGGLDAEERDVILRLCSMLGVDPASFALTVDRGQGR